MFKKNQIKIDKPVIFKLLVLVSISILYLGRSLNDFKIPYVMGDGFEYVLTTEAILNHGTPDIRLSDLNSFKENYIATHKNWEEFSKKDYINELISLYGKSNFEYKSSFGEYFVNSNKKVYSQHFFTYSLINVPFYAMFKSISPLRAFYITNSIMVILVCFFLLFFTPFTTFNSILAALSFCFSSAYWYLAWQHTEIFTMCLVAISFIFYFRNNFLVPVFLIAIATSQNQPLMPLLAFFAITAIIKLKISLKTFIKVGAICFIAIIPPIFYYLNFETTNLIKDAGFLDTKYITSNRIFGFYFDFNQGMILTIPLILLCFIVFVIDDLKKFLFRKAPFNPILFIPIVLIVINLITSTMGNWNHGMAIINRYATWTSIIVMLCTFYLANRKKLIISTVLFNYFFMTQAITTLYHQQFNEFDWSQAKHRPLAKWVLRNHEHLYNPDPVIFSARSQPFTEFKEENSPIIYFHDILVKKVLVHQNRVDDLENFGISKADIAKIKESTSFNYGWGYIDMDYFNTTLSNEQIHNLIAQRAIAVIGNRIRSNPDWLKQVERNAISQKITLEQSIYNDANYVYHENEKLRDKE